MTIEGKCFCHTLKAKQGKKMNTMNSSPHNSLFDVHLKSSDDGLNKANILVMQIIFNAKLAFLFHNLLKLHSSVHRASTSLKNLFKVKIRAPGETKGCVLTDPCHSCHKAFFCLMSSFDSMTVHQFFNLYQHHYPHSVCLFIVTVPFCFLCMSSQLLAALMIMFTSYKRESCSATL